ncbi:hypothetical protein EWB00_000627 [Schistosoma japonicum]|uniref:Uncharacterized protein n=1 Tax=Schistosoma japonicum TaxID=6182 RepID=A0A4Z2CKC0_SCHJA|nr:hypothetical protein EWB00_000627 [Schistosoma japonicum]
MNSGLWKRIKCLTTGFSFLLYTFIPSIMDMHAIILCRSMLLLVFELLILKHDGPNCFWEPLRSIWSAEFIVHGSFLKSTEDDLQYVKRYSKDSVILTIDIL